MTEVSLGNLYEINKEIMKNQSILTKEEIELKKEDILDFLDYKIDNYYFMLLCNDLHDYTVFHIKDKNLNNSVDIRPIANDIIELFDNRNYAILSIDIVNNKTAIEIWVRNKDKDCFVYYFFPYDYGVLEYE